MQRIRHIDERLQAWAEWRMASSGGYRSPSFDFEDRRYTDDPGGGSYVTFSLEQEANALVIDRAVAALPRELAKTVVAAYTWEGGMEIISARLGVTRATVHRRLCNADIRIDGWLIALHEKSEQKTMTKSFASYTD